MDMKFYSSMTHFVNYTFLFRLVEFLLRHGVPYIFYFQYYKAQFLGKLSVNLLQVVKRTNTPLTP